jgi:hypothetical protein
LGELKSFKMFKPFNSFKAYSERDD